MVSAVIITRNEEENIRGCLNAVSWCDEIVVVDDHSTDRTLEIASKLGAKVYKKALGGDFAKLRNFALSKVTSDWAFFIDADEEVSRKLAEEVQRATKKSEYDGYYVSRITIWEGKKLRFGDFIHFSLLRLARTKSGVWEGRVHERWVVDGNIGSLHFPLIHIQRGGVQELLKKINSYSSLRAKELFSQKKKSGFWIIFFFPLSKFILTYFIKLGFLDALPGLLSAIVMSFYTFLVRAKLWLLWHEAASKKA